MRRLALLLALLATPAAAQAFGDCTDPAYFKTFGINTAEGLTCEVIAQENATVNGQAIGVRAIRAKTTPAEWADPFGKETIDATLTAFTTWEGYATQLGFKFPSVTIYITDPLGPGIEAPGERFDNAFADANWFAKPGECFIRFNTQKSANVGIDLIRTIMGHEGFHCVQGESFAPALFGAKASAAWWQEGTASFFGNLAHFTEKDADNLGATFAAKIQTTPLTQLTYPSMTFFAFLWGEGPDATAAFFAGLPTSEGEAAQMEALLASVGPDRLQRFAQAMVDGTVRMPSGYQFPALPDPSTTTFTQDGKVDFPSAPFTILQHALHFTGGNYSVASGIEFFSRKQGTADPWEPMPMDIQPEDCKDIYMLHIVRFDTDTIPAKYPRPLNAFLYLPCWECEKLPKMDQCLAGTWRLSNDSLISFLQSRRVTEEVNYNSMKGQIILTMNPDGTAQWLAEDVAVAADYLPESLAGMEIPFYITVEAFGIDQSEWSGAEGTAHICPVSPGIDFTSTVESSLTGEVKVESSGMVQAMSVAYDCSPQTLAMQYTGPMNLGEAAPRWMFERVK